MARRKFSGSIEEFFARVLARAERDKVKRRLKAAFRRTPRPAKVRIKEDEA